MHHHVRHPSYQQTFLPCFLPVLSVCWSCWSVHILFIHLPLLTIGHIGWAHNDYTLSCITCVKLGLRKKKVTYRYQADCSSPAVPGPLIARGPRFVFTVLTNKHLKKVHDNCIYQIIYIPWQWQTSNAMVTMKNQDTALGRRMQQKHSSRSAAHLDWLGGGPTPVEAPYAAPSSLLAIIVGRWGYLVLSFIFFIRSSCIMYKSSLFCRPKARLDIWFVWSRVSTNWPYIEADILYFLLID